MRKFTLLLGVFMVAFAAQAEETQYIHATTAKLLSEPNFTSSVITAIPRGEAVTVLEAEQKWLKIRYDKKTGWVSKLLLKKDPPLDKASILQNEDSNLADGARKRASANTTTAAARGLREDGRARESDDSNTNFDALTEMESHKVTDQEAMEFVNKNQR